MNPPGGLSSSMRNARHDDRVTENRHQTRQESAASLSEALGKRSSHLYLELIMKPAPADLKRLPAKSNFADRSSKTR